MLFLRAAPIVLLVLAVLYICTFLYLRDTRRSELAADGTTDPAFVDAQVKTYEARLRKQLAIWIFAVPLGAITLLILILENL